VANYVAFYQLQALAVTAQGRCHSQTPDSQRRAVTDKPADLSKPSLFSLLQRFTPENWPARQVGVRLFRQGLSQIDERRSGQRG
jgi:hypothetical protein